MGYEIKLIIGKASFVQGDEHKRDKSKPYSDGSGFELKKDAKGKPIKTGRREQWFQIFGELDLCKLGYNDSPINILIDDTRKRAKELSMKHVHYFYGTDGNTRIDDDKYGDKFFPVPVKDVLFAIRATIKTSVIPYRRLVWAREFLKSLVDDPEGIEVIFFGH